MWFVHYAKCLVSATTWCRGVPVIAGVGVGAHRRCAGWFPLGGFRGWSWALPAVLAVLVVPAVLVVLLVRWGRRRMSPWALPLVAVACGGAAGALVRAYG